MPSYVITGASRGLGYQFLKHLSVDPANTVIGLVRNPGPTNERLRRDGITSVHLLSADVTDDAAVVAAAARATEITGDAGVDVLINNAAYLGEPTRKAVILQHSPQELEAEMLKSFQANVLGPIRVVHAFLPLIRKGAQKKVVYVSTGLADAAFVADYGLATDTPYSVSKAAGNMIMAKYHAALGKAEGIVFLSLSPGFVDTSEGNPQTEQDIKWVGDFFRQIFAEYAPDFKGAITPEESVKLQLGVIGKATVETAGGGFLSHLGTQQWL